MELKEEDIIKFGEFVKGDRKENPALSERAVFLRSQKDTIYDLIEDLKTDCPADILKLRYPSLSNDIFTYIIDQRAHFTRDTFNRQWLDLMIVGMSMFEGLKETRPESPCSEEEK